MTNPISPKMILDAITAVQNESGVSIVQLDGRQAVQLMTILSHNQDSFTRAIQMTNDPVVASYLRQQLTMINKLNEHLQHQLAQNLISKAPKLA